MTPRFAVRSTPYFERLARHLTTQHPEFPRLLAQAIDILEADPANVSRQQNIKKLAAARAGVGRLATRNVLGYTVLGDPQLQAQGSGEVSSRRARRPASRRNTPNGCV
jgi:hypothetical protein